MIHGCNEERQTAEAGEYVVNHRQKEPKEMPSKEQLWQQAQQRLILALDRPDLESALQLLDSCPSIRRVKVGMELYYGSGGSVLSLLQEREIEVFLDLKLYDIPNTVASACRVLARHAVWMLDVHASGGVPMMAAAAEALAEASATVGSPRPKLVGVTILTSFQEAELARTGMTGKAEDLVLQQADLCLQAGLDGIVASPLEVRSLRQRFGRKLTTVIPGIRPGGSAQGDQVRVATPTSALTAGADYLVIGRPIHAADDPEQATHTILEEMAVCLADLEVADA